VERRRKLGVVALVYFIEGYPMGVFDGTLPVWLRVHDVPLEAIGGISVLGLAWSAKVLWSPLVDRFGERRGWVVGALLVMAVGLGVLAAREPRPDAILLAALGLYCLASATQDVAIDAYTIGLTRPGEEGPVNGTRVTAYRVGMIAGGAALLFLPRWLGWPGTLACAALLSVPLAAGVLRAPRVAIPKEARRATWAPLRRWLRLPGSAGVLGFVLLYRVGDLSMGPMVRPLWVDRGVPPEEIGLVTGALGSGAVVAGAALGAAVVARLGIARSLLWLGLAALASNLAYAGAAAVPASGRPGLYAASLVESFCAGLAVTAFLSFCMRITERSHAAVQYAVLSALFVLPGRLLGGISGWASVHLGYAGWFAATALAALPALALLPWARARLERLDALDRRQAPSP